MTIGHLSTEQFDDTSTNLGSVLGACGTTLMSCSASAVAQRSRRGTVTTFRQFTAIYLS